LLVASPLFTGCVLFGGDRGPAPAPDHAASALDAGRLEAATRSLGLRSAGNGQVRNDCDEAVTPEVYVADLGGAVGRAFLIVVGGGPGALTCYGMTGMAIHLVKPEGEGFRSLYSGAGHLVIMPTSHNGVRDILIGGPGLEFPVMHWNGSAYEFAGMISEGEPLPAPLN
jgi:hypothetical protein